MSELSTRIRRLVKVDETGYGEWGALRPDQRRLIRELCDLCDSFEKAADEAHKHLALIKRPELCDACVYGDCSIGCKTCKACAQNISAGVETYDGYKATCRCLTVEFGHQCPYYKAVLSNGVKQFMQFKKE